MIKNYSRKQAISILKKSIKAFGLDKNLKTDPQIMQNIIKEFKLNDFKTDNKQMRQFLKNVISKPQNLQPILNNIKNGILSKHPAIIEFANLALKKKWFEPSNNVIKSIHVTYILEAITVAMCNRHNFFIEVQNHYKKKERERGINSMHLFKTFIQSLKISHSYFLTTKAFSVDALMVYFRIQRGLNQSHLTKKELKQLYKNHKLSYLENKLLTPTNTKKRHRLNELIRINIYEAGITEYKNNLKTNAICAHVLSENIKNNPPFTIFKNKHILPQNNIDPFYKKITENRNYFPSIGFNQNWISLYVTWNMAYVLNELDDLDIIFPKLLMPSILNAKSENFMGVRFISLWLSLNHGFFRMYDKKKVLGPNNKRIMATAWSKINKKYAFNLAKQEMREDSKTISKSYKRFFSQPIYNLFKLIKIFMN